MQELEKFAPTDLGRVDVLYYCHLIFDTHKADVISRENGRPWVYGPGGSPEYLAQPEQLLAYLKVHVDDIVVSCPPNQERNPIATWLDQQDKDGNLKKSGLVRLGEIPWDGARDNTLIVYRIPKNT